MEAQLKSIQMYVQTTEKQRQEADAKLEEALHINKKTQVHNVTLFKSCLFPIDAYSMSLMHVDTRRRQALM